MPRGPIVARYGKITVTRAARARNACPSPDSLAEGVGFEPTSDFRRCRFSRPVPSTARPPLRARASEATITLAMITACGKYLSYWRFGKAL